MRFDETGIDVLGIVTNEVRTQELLSAKVLVSPALGGESFGMVLVEAFASATPVGGVEHPGLRRRGDAGRGDARAAGRPEAALAEAVDRRARRRGAARRDGPRRPRARARSTTAWHDIARRLEEVYEEVAA